MVKRVILDTNLWISFLISKNYRSLDTHLLQGKVTLLFSEELLSEFLAVTQRPKFVKYFSDKDVAKLLEMMDNFGEVVEVTSELKLCRDEKDNFLLNLALDSQADFLVSGDSDLLILEQVEKTQILTFSEFIDKL
jgi:putative PIN family toxin of toxin-antitoxin system